MYKCPQCGTQFKVARIKPEVRKSGVVERYARRERVCTKPGCGFKLMTIEMPLAELQTLRALADRLIPYD